MSIYPHKSHFMLSSAFASDFSARTAEMDTPPNQAMQHSSCVATEAAGQASFTGYPLPLLQLVFALSLNQGILHRGG